MGAVSCWNDYFLIQKQVCLNGGEDSSKSSESSEFDSSEETASHSEPTQTAPQPASPETEVPNAMEETDPPYSAGPLLPGEPGPSPTIIDTSASPLPDFEDPQTSTDIGPLQLMPDSDPSQTSLGVDISRDMPDSDQSQDSFNADIARVSPDMGGSQQRVLTDADFNIGIDATGTIQPPLSTATYHVFPLGATPSRSPDIMKPTPPPLSAVPPRHVPAGTAEVTTGVPVCFTLQLTTAEPSPPRGDSI